MARTPLLRSLRKLYIANACPRDTGCRSKRSVSHATAAARRDRGGLWSRTCTGINRRTRAVLDGDPDPFMMMAALVTTSGGESKET